MSIDSIINDSFGKLADISEKAIFFSFDLGVMNAAGDPVKLPFILLWLAGASIFFTLYFGFINIRCFGHSVAVALNRYHDPEAEGQLSSFKALATSLSGTVGLGNIAGVAVAISVGGPGAALWMAIMGMISMSTKFIEVSLGVKYRHHQDPTRPSEISGGPMYYLRDALANRNLGKLGMVLALVFCVACIGGAIGGGNMFQANQTFVQFVTVTGGEQSWFADKGWFYGLLLAALVGAVIIGGLKSIANVSAAMVPAMAGIYMLTAFVVIAFSWQNIPHALATIVTSAFSLEAGIGGFIGAVLAGVQRASFSNEAGLGSSAIVHATAKTRIPVQQGIAGMMGSFVDTVIVCMATALMLVISGDYVATETVKGVTLVSQAMGGAVSWFPYILAFCVFLFAYSTLITWYYYGEKSLTFMFGEKAWLIFMFKLVYCTFTVIGCSAELGNVIRFSDAMILSMAFPNIIGLYICAPEIKRDLKAYLERLKAEKTVPR